MTSSPRHRGGSRVLVLTTLAAMVPAGLIALHASRPANDSGVAHPTQLLAKVSADEPPRQYAQATRPPASSSKAGSKKSIDPFELATKFTPRNIDALRRYLDAGGNPDYLGKHGYTALGVACDKFDTDLITALLAAGADPNFGPDRPHRHPIESLLRADHEDVGVLQQLLDAGLDANSPATQRGLRQAVIRGINLNLIERLIEAGFDPAVEDENRLTALNFAEDYYRDNFASVLRDAGGVRGPGALPRPVVFEYVGKGSSWGTQELGRLLESGAPVDVKGSTYRVTPLAHFGRLGSPNDQTAEQITLLLEHGADVTQAPDLAFTVTRIYFRDNAPRAALLDRLNEAGVDFNRPNREGNTPLTQAADKRQYAWIAPLIAVGADPNLADRHGRTVATILDGIKARLRPAQQADLDAARAALAGPQPAKSLTFRAADAPDQIVEEAWGGEPARLALIGTTADVEDTVGLMQALLSDAPSLQLVERSQLDQITEELHLAASMNDDNALRLAGQVGAELLLVVSPAADDQVRWRMLDVRRGVVNDQQAADPGDLLDAPNDLIDRVMRVAYSVRAPAAHQAALAWTGLRWVAAPGSTTLDLDALNGDVLRHLITVPGLVMTERFELQTAARETDLGADPSAFVVSAQLNGTAERAADGSRIVLELTDNAGRSRRSAFNVTPGDLDTAREIVERSLVLLNQTDPAYTAPTQRFAANREARQLLQEAARRAGQKDHARSASLALSAVSLAPSIANYRDATRLHRTFYKSIARNDPGRIEAMRQHLNLVDRYLGRLETNSQQNTPLSASTLQVLAADVDYMFEVEAPAPRAVLRAMRRQTDDFWDRNGRLLQARGASTVNYQAVHTMYLLRRRNADPMPASQVIRGLRAVDQQWREEAGVNDAYPLRLIYVNNIWDGVNIRDQRGATTARLLRKEDSPYLQAAGWMRELWVPPLKKHPAVLNQMLDRFLPGASEPTPTFLRSDGFDDALADAINDAESLTAERAEEVLARVAETEDYAPWLYNHDSLSALIEKLPSDRQRAYAEKARAILKASHPARQNRSLNGVLKDYAAIIKRQDSAGSAATAAPPANGRELKLIRLDIDSPARLRLLALTVGLTQGQTPAIYGLRLEKQKTLALMRWDLNGQNPHPLTRFDVSDEPNPQYRRPQLLIGEDRVFVIFADVIRTYVGERVIETPRQADAEHFATDGTRLWFGGSGFLAYVDPTTSAEAMVVASYVRKERTNLLDGGGWTLNALQADPMNGDVYARTSRHPAGQLWRIKAETLLPEPAEAKLKASDTLVFANDGPMLIQRQGGTPARPRPFDRATLTLGDARPLQPTDRFQGPTEFAVNEGMLVTSIFGYPAFFGPTDTKPTFFKDQPTLEELYPLADGRLLGRHNTRSREFQPMKLYRVSF